MRIIVLGELIDQTKSHQISNETVKKIQDELRRIKEIERSGYNTIMAYLVNHNGKELAGKQGKFEHTYKYKLSDGDRLLYTYGKYVDSISSTEESTLIIIKYAKHDDQARESGSVHNYNEMTVSEAYNEIDQHIITDEDLITWDFLNVDNAIESLNSVFSGIHSMYVANEDKLINEDAENDCWDVLLSPEQNKIINDFLKNQSPVLLVSGAGTGKTLVLVHTANDFVHSGNDVKCIYFTQSRALLNNCREIYKKISGDEASGKFEVADINEYCLDLIKIEGSKSDNLFNRDNIVKADEFTNNFFKNNKAVIDISQKCNFSVSDIWTEIRGIIKGSLDENWNRFTPLSQDNFRGDFVSNLEKHGLIKRLPPDKKFFILSDDWKEKSIDFLTYKEQEIFFRDIKSYFNNIDTTIKYISRNEYKAFSDELSIIPFELRDRVYDIFELYQKWLDEKGKIDENDVALNAISVVNEYKKNKTEFEYATDFLVVDESQDYTELQLYFAHMLLKNGNCVMYAGDHQQIINPSIFDYRKLNRLHGKLEDNQLPHNYRCQNEIVRLVNAIRKIRTIKVAKKKGDDVFETSAKSGVDPVKLTCDKKTVNQLIENLSDFPGTAVIVPDDATKQKLINAYGTEKYNKLENKIISTIPEVKGMEYKYVVCYNIIGTFNDIWKDIMNLSNSKKTKYRYYFNLLYVAVTRAKDFLIFIEDDFSNPFWKELESTDKDIIFTELNEYDISCLYISSLRNSDEEWLKQADEYRSNGRYSDALGIYLKFGGSRDKIYMCKAEIALEDKDSNKAGIYFSLCGNKADAIKYSESNGVVRDIVNVILKNGNKVISSAKTMLNYVIKNFADDDDIALIPSELMLYFADYSSQNIETIRGYINEFNK